MYVRFRVKVILVCATPTKSGAFLALYNLAIKVVPLLSLEAKFNGVNIHAKIRLSSNPNAS